MFSNPVILEDPVVFTTPPVNFPAPVILQARWITHHFYIYIYIFDFKPAHYTCCKVLYRYYYFYCSYTNERILHFYLIILFNVNTDTDNLY